MLREHWNFHGDIAIQLEAIACNHYDITTGRPFTKIYDADSIENGRFVEVMISLLRGKTQMDNSHTEIDEFITECAPYLGKQSSQIPNKIAQELYDRFISLYRS